MGRFMKVDVLMFLFNVVRQNELLWDVVQLRDGDYSLAKKLKLGNFWGYEPEAARLIVGI
jgi:hypothetical protein